MEAAVPRSTRVTGTMTLPAARSAGRPGPDSERRSAPPPTPASPPSGPLPRAPRRPGAVPRARSARQLGLDFEALYRAARDDVFAYVATLLRDRAAAEDVTALAFERAYRRRASTTPSAAASARGCSGSPATRRSTSCAGA